ncbi:DNA recombination protein RmuC [Aquibaculum sediminis]|uniref:DNA recombination protein RmuC n=1 Tax=Aquibaculum sediminis TaxID=3231907 RepID=UPI003453D24B
MDPTLLAVVAAVLAGALLGAFLTHVLLRKGAQAREELLRQQIEELAPYREEAFALREPATRLARAEEERDALREERNNALRDNERLGVTLEKERQAHEQKLQELSSVRGQIEKDLKLLSQSLLKDTSDAFLKRAREVFEAQQKESRSGLESLVKPVGEALKAYQEKLAASEQARKRDEGRIGEQLRQVAESHAKLQHTTGTLVNALRAAPKTRGRWGEQQLRTVLEMAGMMEYVDFTTEHHVATSDGPLRPDVVLRLPGGRRIVVDAKTSMSAYLEAIEAVDDGERERLLREHARQLRTHARQLGDKRYWDALEDTPDFVVMFVPGDNLYAAAIERDPNLFEEAYSQHVIIATPTTFLALAKAIAYGWRQERVSQDAQQVMTLGEELYKRLVRLGDRLSSLTKALETTVKRHNDLVGTLEGTVLPQARRFNDFGLGQAHGEIEESPPVLTDVREAVRGRDLEFAEEEEQESLTSTRSG